MAHWLMKSEPHKYAWEDLVRDGRTAWDGVRNNQAALYLRAMRVGDEAIFYHSNEGLAAVGVMRVVREAYPDPGDPAGRFVCVDVAPARAFPRPIPLSAMKGEAALADMAMFRQFRLSVVPLEPRHWGVLMGLAGA